MWYLASVTKSAGRPPALTLMEKIADLTLITNLLMTA